MIKASSKLMGIVREFKSLFPDFWYHIVRYVFPFQKKIKNLEPSCKADLEFWDYFLGPFIPK